MYRQNKDLITVGLFGFIYYAIVIGFSGNMTQIALAEYFAFPYLVALLMAFSIHRPSQMIEWPLCFLFGGVLASTMLLSILSYLGSPYTIHEFSTILSSTFAWYGLVSIVVLVGLASGAFLKSTYTLVMGSLDVSLEY